MDGTLKYDKIILGASINMINDTTMVHYIDFYDSNSLDGPIGPIMLC